MAKKYPTKKYVMNGMPKSTCPHCTRTVTWLSPRMAALIDEDPTFFICWHCQFIGQVGYGEVEAEHA